MKKNYRRKPEPKPFVALALSACMHACIYAFTRCCFSCCDNARRVKWIGFSSVYQSTGRVLALLFLLLPDSHSTLSTTPMREQRAQQQPTKQPTKQADYSEHSPPSVSQPAAQQYYCCCNDVDEVAHQTRACPVWM